MSHGKTYLSARGAIDRERVYSPAEAVRLVKSMPGPKFDETVEVHFSLGLNVRHAEQQLRGTISLPHGTGREQRVAVCDHLDCVDQLVSAGVLDDEPGRAGAHGLV